MSECDERLDLLKQWLVEVLKESELTMTPASSDASFRRYFRVVSGQGSLIAMDAPPGMEDAQRFVRIADDLRSAWVHAPDIFAGDFERGFLLISDFGDQSYFKSLTDENVNALYADAFETLLKMQSQVTLDTADLPMYDAELLNRELGIFSEWFVAGLLDIELETAQQAVIETGFKILVESALDQPRVCVHRDFHSRNLMVLEHDNPGVIDFQDAVFGPLTYDLVSLLRDCYVSWPAQHVGQWMQDFYTRSVEVGIISETVSLKQYRQWFDRMGVQRHLKAIGIFSRLKLRDSKPGYLADIPLTLGYVLDVCRNDQELTDFAHLIEQVIMPVFQSRTDLH